MHSLLLEARVVELVDTGDLKSPDRKIVPVQVRPRAPSRQHYPSKKTTLLDVNNYPCIKFNS